MQTDSMDEFGIHALSNGDIALVIGAACVFTSHEKIGRLYKVLEAYLLEAITTAPSAGRAIEIAELLGAHVSKEFLRNRGRAVVRVADEIVRDLTIIAAMREPRARLSQVVNGVLTDYLRKNPPATKGLRK